MSEVRELALRLFRQWLRPWIERAAAEPAMTAVFYDGAGRVTVRVGHELRRVEEHIIDDEAVLTAGAWAASFAGEAWNRERPVLSVMVEDGWRCSFSRPPIVRQPAMALRKLARVAIPLSRYVEQGIVTWEQKVHLESLVADRKTIVVVGPMGSGKTTLLRSILELVPPEERIATIEDARELALTGTDGVTPRENWLPLLAVPGVRTMAGLLQDALRFEVDRIVIGEVRGPEALEFVMAAKTGHPGMVTVHADGERDAIDRLHEMVRLVQPGYDRPAVARAIGAVVHITGMGERRRVESIWENDDGLS